MRTESLVITAVHKDLLLLVPNASFDLPFFPTGGRAVFHAWTTRAPATAVTGSAPAQRVRPGRPRPNVGPTLTTAGTSGTVAVLARPQEPLEEPGLADLGTEAEGRLTLAALQQGTRPFRPGGLGDALEPLLPVLPDRPPHPAAPTGRFELFREGDPTPVLTEEFRELRTALTQVIVPTPPPLIVGEAPERWVARFTNISDKPVHCLGRIQYQERRTVEVTTIPIRLLRRLVREAVVGIGLRIFIDDKTATFDVSPQVRAVFPFTSISKTFDFPGNFHDIGLERVSVELDEGPGPHPSIRISLDLETEGIEYTFRYKGRTFAAADIQELGVDLDLRLSNRVRRPEPEWDNVRVDEGRGRVHGDFSGEPFLFSDIELTPRLRVPTSPGIPTGLVDAVSDRLRLVGQEFVEENSHELSSVLQVGLQMATDPNHRFHGLRRAANGDWEVLSRPVSTRSVRPPRTRPAFSPPIAPIDGAQPVEETEALGNIKHIVFLMMENRSFDHVLGHLSHPDHGNDPRYDGLSASFANRIANLAPEARPAPMRSTLFHVSPNHEHEPVMAQIAGGAMSGFGESFRSRIHRSGTTAADPRSIMNFHVRGQLKSYDGLVADFTVADRWFASIPGPTFPNRMCALTGSTPFLANDGFIEHAGYLTDLTIFDVLDEAGVNWKFYEHDVTFLRLFDRFRLNDSHVRSFDDFADDASGGLPPVTFIDPNFYDVPSGGVANDDHPGGADMAAGQALVAKVVNAVSHSPGWDDTLLVITYDEHGGFFDHVPPPGCAANPFGALIGACADGPAQLGVRVPAFIVSPRAEAGGVVDRIYDHTSILRTILATFAPDQQHRLGRKVQQAAHLGGAVMGPVRNVQTSYSESFSAAPLREQPDPGSFHDTISSSGSPTHLTAEEVRFLHP